MYAASTNGGGSCEAFPDVCKTPLPIVGVQPVPYNNVGQCTQAKGSTCSSKVKIKNKKTLIKKTEIEKSQGDEPGVIKGVIQKKHRDKVKRTGAFDKIKVEGASIVTAMRGTSNNGASANAPPGQQLKASQTKVICLG